MTDVLIACLSATSSGEDQPRVRRLLHAVAGRHLSEAIAAVGLPPGEWCVRRLDVPVRLDPGRADAAVQSSWAGEIAAALSDLLWSARPDGQHVVHYPRALDALADLLCALACGRADRAWAWRQMALLQPGDPDPHTAPRGAALAALSRRPAQAVPALGAAVRLAGADALHRLLGSAGWAELSRLVIRLHHGDLELAVPSPPGSAPSASAGTRRPGHAPAAEGRRGRTGPAGDQGRPAAGEDEAPAGRDDAAGGRDDAAAGRDKPSAAGSHVPSGLAGSIRHRSRLAAAFARARIRPDLPTAWAWAVLSAAEAEPALFARPAAGPVLADLAGSFGTAPSAGTARSASRLAAASGTAGGMVRRPDPGHEAGSEDGDVPDTRVQARSDMPDEAIAAGRGPSAWPTRWAGLPFFLATAEEAGLPDVILSDEVLADRPLSWTVYQLARRLVPAADAPDPAQFALAGLVPAGEPGPPQPDEAARLDVYAGSWARITAARLGRDEDDAFAVAARLAARTGSIVASPGWIEVRLALADVDVGVRRAGLDLDPGWVPWIGAVVMFVYA